MSVARAKKKKSKGYNQHDFKRVVEANRLCLACAIEQLYEDKGWRTKRINNLVTAYYREMCNADKLMKSGVDDVPTVLAKQTGDWLGEDILEIASSFGDAYRQHCYRLCISTLVQALRKLGVNKTRIRMIVCEIRHDYLNYELWSVYKSVADKTGYDVKTAF